MTSSVGADDKGDDTVKNLWKQETSWKTVIFVESNVDHDYYSFLFLLGKLDETNDQKCHGVIMCGGKCPSQVCFAGEIDDQ